MPAQTQESMQNSCDLSFLAPFILSYAGCLCESLKAKQAAPSWSNFLHLEHPSPCSHVSWGDGWRHWHSLQVTEHCMQAGISFRFCTTRYLQSSTSPPSEGLRKILVFLPHHCPCLMVSQQSSTKLCSPSMGSAWEKPAAPTAFSDKGPWIVLVSAVSSHASLNLTNVCWGSAGSSMQHQKVQLAHSSSFSLQTKHQPLGRGPAMNSYGVTYIWAESFAAALGESKVR